MGRLDLVKLGSGGHGLAGCVHVGLGAHEQHPRARYGGFTYQSIELGAVGGAMVALTDGIHAEESCVVTGQSVLLAGVAQTHQKMGDGGSGGGSLVLLKPLEDVENVGHVDSFSRYEFHDI